MQMGDQQLKVGVIGMGKMGILHSCILNILPGIKLTAQCEKNSLTRILLRKLFQDVRIVDDVSKLAGIGLDAVFVTTPIPSHFAVAKAVCDYKVASSLFVEKTLAATYDDARRLNELAAGLKGANMVGYLRRYYVTFRKAKELLSQQVIGDVFSFKAYGFSSDFLGASVGSASPIARGGVLKDLGCHVIDLALWFFGDLRVVSAKIEPIIGTDSEDSVDFQVRNQRGLEGTFDISWCMPRYRMPEVGLSVSGSEGRIEVNDDRVSLETKKEGSCTWFRHDLNDNVGFWLGLPEYYREDVHFIESIRKQRRAEPDFLEAAKVDKIIQQVEQEAGKIE
jgi:predicted dehydrogenase